MGDSKGLGSLHLPVHPHTVEHCVLKLGVLAALFYPEVLSLCLCSQVNRRFSPLSALLRVKER